ncbi:hypothetical protein BDZ91DRAFT_724808 [Kalaharituber pfeilii]|nr:hypothetical protein BDZ91DRAFT_724808 [Kalaharituber pfeilii]
MYVFPHSHLICRDYIALHRDVPSWGRRKQIQLFCALLFVTPNFIFIELALSASLLLLQFGPCIFSLFFLRSLSFSFCKFHLLHYTLIAAFQHVCIGIFLFFHAFHVF